MPVGFEKFAPKRPRRGGLILSDIIN